ncbi:cytoplasmic copper homeostasis protein cutC [Aquipluma nitroreducens]|uniref:PF03932 family protein CutC n=1 Tax=Aquipluma nitroreducens TaxID=2010828 RepID=A0A5K7SCL6_9BACT|nr:copper homeostasis protein CutC [Aquipluma nitroreducens]BBE19024.1 cytoplasmic copper homeostasis protein cutC [Aquipluma nitroreducens]
MHNSLIFEACVESLDDAIAAEKRGANRIELCSALDQDGLTPSPELTLKCLQHLTIPVMAMVRPRGGNFVYAEDEILLMEAEIEYFKGSGVAGVVFGLLTNDGAIDVENTRRLAKLASPLEVTFHKAIDYSDDILKSFQELNTIEGITRVLTSGGMDTAWNGRNILKQMQDIPGRRIEIIAAGKVLPANRLQIAEFTGVSELHGQRIV